jgi:glutaminase
VFALNLALDRVGAALWNHVGREPSGSPFNSIVQLEQEKGKPRNPLINAGAIVTMDNIIGDGTADEAVAEVLAFLRERSGDAGIDIDQQVAISESQAGSSTAASPISCPHSAICATRWRMCSRPTSASARSR